MSGNSVLYTHKQAPTKVSEMAENTFVESENNLLPLFRHYN